MEETKKAVWGLIQSLRKVSDMQITLIERTEKKIQYRTGKADGLMEASNELAKLYNKYFFSSPTEIKQYETKPN